MGKRSRLVAAILAVLLILAVLCARSFLIPGGPGRADHSEGAVPLGGGDLPDDGDSFAGPAFQPGATDEQLDNAAREAAQALTRRFPDSPDAWYALGRVQFGLGRRVAAVASWKRCLELAPKHLEAHHGLARAAFGRADYDAAEQWSRKWLALDPRDHRAQSMLAEVLSKLDQLDNLITVFEPVFLRAELSPEAGVQLGLAQLQLQQFAPAERTFQAVLAGTDEPRLQKRAHYGLAAVYARQDRPELACRHREQFQQLSDSDLSATRQRVRTLDDEDSRRIAVEAHNECGRVYEQHGDPDAAEQFWRMAAVLGPEDVESRTQLALLYERTNRERQALRRCEQLRDLQPDNPDHWLNVGLLRARLQQFDLARKALAKALELAPDEPRYRRAYEAIQNQH